MDVLDRIIQHYGTVERVRDRFGYSDVAAVYNWRYRGVPSEKWADLHLEAGIDLDSLRFRPNKKPIAA